MDQAKNIVKVAMEIYLVLCGTVSLLAALVGWVIYLAFRPDKPSKATQG